jgi:agmatinase
MEIKSYSGNYCDLKPPYCEYKNSAIVILPIIYELTSTWQKGSQNGPLALLEASKNLELYDIETGTEVYKKGITTLSPLITFATSEEMIDSVYNHVKTVLKDGKFCVGVGGEHTTSIGIVKAMSEYFSSLTVLQLDAHLDLRDEYNRSKFNHACTMARIREICPIVQIGIRSMDISENEKVHKDRIIYAHEFHSGWKGTQEISRQLSEDVYLTIDFDVFDPSIMPSTGTPEPGGLGWYDVTRIVDEISNEKRIVGMDVNELMPNPNNRAPDFLAAKLIYRILSIIFSKGRRNG